MRFLERRRGKEHMFSLFEQCTEELERMKADGAYVERHTESGRLAAENGVESHFADLPLVYGIMQTPTFRKHIATPQNYVFHADTKEPMLVYHATQVDIPTAAGLQPSVAEAPEFRILGKRPSLAEALRRALDWHPKKNWGLHFASDPLTTKYKAAGETRTEDREPIVYAAFVRIEKPHMIHTRDAQSDMPEIFSEEQSDGEIKVIGPGNVDFMVKSATQVMHVPMSPVGVYDNTPLTIGLD